MNNANIIVADGAMIGATVLSLALHMPQLWQTYSTRNVESFNRQTIFLRVLASVCYLVYGILRDLMLLSLTSMLIIFCEAMLLTMCYVFAVGDAPQQATAADGES